MPRTATVETTTYPDGRTTTVVRHHAPPPKRPPSAHPGPGIVLEVLPGGRVWVPRGCQSCPAMALAEVAASRATADARTLPPAPRREVIETTGETIADVVELDAYRDASPPSRRAS